MKIFCPRLCLCCAFVCAFLPFCFGLCVATPAQAQGLTHVETELEKLVGKQVARTLADNSGIDTDPLLANWVKRIGASVAAESFRKDIQPDFNILGTDTANALAAPGGHIFVTRGLLDVIDSDDELASVLGHETGHHAKRHAIRQIEANVLFLGLFTAFGDRAGRTGRAGLTAYNILRTLDKSREMEAQADEVGIGFANGAGYDGRGIVRFLDGFDRGKRNFLEEYLATHPSPNSRIVQANKNPLLSRTTEAEREQAAQGYEARGLITSARKTREGKDALELPALAPVSTPAYLTSDREQVFTQAERIRKATEKVGTSDRLANTFQQVLIINNQPTDIRWLYLAGRAYGVQTRVQDLLSRTARTARTAPGTYEALTAYADRAPDINGVNAGAEAALGRGEVRRALDRLQGAPTPIGRASRAVAFVLLDLNNRFLRTNSTLAWVRYLMLELTLRYAESELSRADRMSGEAWRILSLARIRRYQLRLNDLVGDDGERRARWYDLAQQRFGAAFPTNGPAGEATVRAALAVEKGASVSEIEKGRNETPWAEWVLQKRGIPENVATAIRLLTLDLEREL